MLGKLMLTNRADFAFGIYIHRAIRAFLFLHEEALGVEPPLELSPPACRNGCKWSHLFEFFLYKLCRFCRSHYFHLFKIMLCSFFFFFLDLSASSFLCLECFTFALSRNRVYFWTFT